MKCRSQYNVHMKLKKQYKIIQDVVQLVAGYFDLDVDVEITTGKLSEGHQAEVGQECPGFYTIEYDKKFLTTAGIDDIIRITAHEMVHVKQYELDGLELTEQESIFRGKKWIGEYWFSPWEVEARGYELAFQQHYLYYGSDNAKAAAAKPVSYTV